MRKILNLGLGALLVSRPEFASLSVRDRSNKPKFRLPSGPAGPVTDSTPESKRAKRRRLARAPK